MKTDKIKEQIKKERIEAGQPVQLTEEDKKVNMIVKKVTDELLKHTCRRCTCILKGEIEQERDYCDHCWEMVLDQREHERIEKDMFLKDKIDAVVREKEFKEDQVTSGNIKETLSIVTGDDGKPLVCEGFAGGVKPKFMLLNEIADLKTREKLYNKQIENMEKAVKEDDRLTKPGSKGA